MATNTKNYGFKKPDESDFYSIQDQNGNWDKVDEEMGNLDSPSFEDYTSGESQVPDAAAALAGIKSKSKLGLLFSNIKALGNGLMDMYKENQQKLEARPVNNNILINSNFANPVNQRGVTSLNGIIMQYFIDRWLVIGDGSGDFEVVNEGIKVNNTSTVEEDKFLSIRQRVEFPERYNGETITFSFAANGTTYHKTVTLNLQGPEYIVDEVLDGLKIQIQYKENVLEVSIVVSSQKTFIIHWAKLELGDTSTPYVPRLYAEELELCKRYYQVMRLSCNYPDIVSSAYVRFRIFYEKEMRVKPTMTSEPGFQIMKQGTTLDGFTYELTPNSEKHCTIIARKDNNGLTEINRMSFNGARIYLDAEL